MNPYYNSWSVSVHKNTNCVQCHIPPGFPSFVKTKILSLRELWVHVFGKAEPPLAVTRKIPNSNCLACHANPPTVHEEAQGDTTHLPAFGACRGEVRGLSRPPGASHGHPAGLRGPDDHVPVPHLPQRPERGAAQAPAAPVTPRRTSPGASAATVTTPTASPAPRLPPRITRWRLPAATKGCPAPRVT